MKTEMMKMSLKKTSSIGKNLEKFNLFHALRSFCVWRAVRFVIVFFRDDYGESQELVLLTAQPLRVQTLFHTYNNMDIEVKIRGLGTVRPLSFGGGLRVRNFALLKKSNQIQIILLIHAMPSHVFPERKITAQIIQQICCFTAPFQRNNSVIRAVGNKKTKPF